MLHKTSTKRVTWAHNKSSISIAKISLIYYLFYLFICGNSFIVFFFCFAHYFPPPLTLFVWFFFINFKERKYCSYVSSSRVSEVLYICFVLKCNERSRGRVFRHELNVLGFVTLSHTIFWSGFVIFYSLFTINGAVFINP